MYSLDNCSNYKYELLSTSTNIFKLYLDIIDNYITAYVSFIHHNIKQNDLYYYLLNKGINTISHIFKILLINTKNIELTKYHCIKTINYYIEFIKQNHTEAENKIGDTHASLFSYGNTIFKLNQAYRKTVRTIPDENMVAILYDIEEREGYILKNVELMINIYHILLSLYFNNYITELNLSAGREDLSEYIRKHTAIFMEHFSPISICNDSCEKEYKLTFLIDFIHTANMASANMASANMASANMASANMASANQIYILIAQLQDKYPYRLNKAVLVKKILHKNKLATDNAEEYIKELLY